MLAVKHPRFHGLTLKWTSPNPNFALPYRNYLSRPPVLLYREQRQVPDVHRGELLCHSDRSERSSRIKRF